MMLKRLFRIPSLCAMLALLFVCILLCGSLAADSGLPICGIVSGKDPLAAEVCARLTADGFVPYESEDALRHAITRGEVAMGMVLPDNFTDRLARGSVNGLIAFLEAPSAVLQPLYRYRAAAHLFEAYVPYLTSDLLADAGVERTPDEMRGEIETYLASEDTFTFTFTTVAGAEIETEHPAKTWTKGAVALLLFFALPLFAVPFSGAQYAPLCRRLGCARAFRAYALPSMLWGTALFAAVTASALLLSEWIFANGAAAYIGAAVLYAVFLAALGILATALVGDIAVLRVPMIVLALLSLCFCPIVADLPKLLGIPLWPRLLLPPTFFYAAFEHPLSAAIIAFALFAAALGGYYGRSIKR